MTDDLDAGTTNPLAEVPGDDGTETDEYHLTEILRGRMFCLAHGRECYRRTPIIDGDEWICPDERHRRPIRSS